MALAVAWGLGAVVLVALLYVWKVQDISVGLLTRDAADSLAGPTYLAAVTNLAYALWAVAGTSAVLGSRLVRRLDPTAKRTAAFLMAGGLLSFLLLADDMWLLHDRVFPANIGIPESVVYATYALLTLAYLFVFRDQIVRTEYLVLLCAAVIFGFAMGIDFLTNDDAPSSAKYFKEDVPKFLGLSTWCAYQARTAYLLVVRSAERDQSLPVENPSLPIS